ncbi:MAG: hypothetical protein V3U76_01110 [Granulosicoccus sp.]
MNTQIENTPDVFNIFISGSNNTEISTIIETVCNTSTPINAEEPFDDSDPTEQDTAPSLLTLDENISFNIYTTSEQELSEGSDEANTGIYDGLIILLNGANDSALDVLENHVTEHQELIDSRPFIIGVTQLPTAIVGGINHFRQMLEQLKIRAPLYEIDVTSERDILLLFRTFLACETLP